MLFQRVLLVKCRQESFFINEQLTTEFVTDFYLIFSQFFVIDTLGERLCLVNVLLPVEHAFEF